jgi:hypothetical protein
MARCIYAETRTDDRARRAARSGIEFGRSDPKPSGAAGNACGSYVPNLISEGEPVPTIANRALLVAYAWPDNTIRQKRLAKFVGEFFGKIDQFRGGARHPKWAEINLAAKIPGWTRFKPAADWLAEKRNVAARDQSQPGPPGDLTRAFQQFLDTYAASSGQKTLSPNEREQLYAEFWQFLETKNGKQPVR